MRVKTTYQTVRSGELTRCERLTIQAVSGEDMEALHALAKLLTTGEPVQAVVRRLERAGVAPAAAKELADEKLRAGWEDAAAEKMERAEPRNDLLGGLTRSPEVAEAMRQAAAGVLTNQPNDPARTARVIAEAEELAKAPDGP